MKLGQNTEHPVQFYIDKPLFEGQQNVLAHCDLCEWDYAGPRATVKEAWNEHYRMCHIEQVGVMRLDKQLRKSIWLPGG